MPVHWSWDISFGQTVLAIPISFIFIMLLKMFKILLLFRMEHELLMQDWADRNNKILSELHTRKKFWW